MIESGTGLCVDETARESSILPAPWTVPGLATGLTCLARYVNGRHSRVCLPVQWVWQTMMGTSAALALAALVRGESRLSGARRR